MLSTDAADDALTAMIGGSFRHVPVLSPSGGAPAILDLVRCLFDVIRMLERAQAAGEALIDAVSSRNAGGGMSDVLAPALRTLLAPSLRSLASSCTAPAVLGPSASLQEAAAAMLAPGVTAVLVCTGSAQEASSEEEGSSNNAAGRYALLTPRSLLTAVVGAGDASAASATAFASCTALDVSGGEPLLPPADCSVLDALHLLQAERCTHALLLSPSDGAACGPAALLDMLQLVRASVSHTERSADAQQLHAFWGAAAALSDVGGPTASSSSKSAAAAGAGAGGTSGASAPPRVQARAPGHAPTLLGGIGEDEPCDDFSDLDQRTLVSEYDVGDDALTEVRPEDSISMAGVQRHVPSAGPHGQQAGAGMAAAQAGAGLKSAQLHHLAGCEPSVDGSVLFKLRDPSSGNLHRVRCMPAEGWKALQDAVQARFGAEAGALVKLLYRDDDGDQVAIDSDDTLWEAAAQARRVGQRLNATAVCGGGGFDTDGAPQTPSGAAQGAGNAAAVLGAGNAAASSVAAAASGMDRSSVKSFLGGLLAASSLAVGAGLVLAAKSAKR